MQQQNRNINQSRTTEKARFHLFIDKELLNNFKIEAKKLNISTAKYINNLLESEYTFNKPEIKQ